jgi:hypothetical protein
LSAADVLLFFLADSLDLEMPKRSRESEGGDQAAGSGALVAVSKKKRDSTGGAAAAAAAEAEGGGGGAAKGSSRKGRSSLGGGGGKQLQPMLLPCTLPARLKEGQELVLLRYPAAFDLARLQGCELPAALLGGALGGGHALELAGGGAARLAAAPRSVASQGLFVAAVVGAAEEEEEEKEEAPPSVRFLPTPAALVLDLTLAPQQAPPLPGLRSVVLTRRAPVPRAAHGALPSRL